MFRLQLIHIIIMFPVSEISWSFNERITFRHLHRIPVIAKIRGEYVVAMSPITEEVFVIVAKVMFQNVSSSLGIPTSPTT